MFSIDLTPGKYVPDLQQWQPLRAQEVKRSDINHLTVATLNVWFDENYYFDARCRATLALLATDQPDIITLQEVTPAFLTQILHTPWIQAAYQVSDIYGDSIDPYGVLILSRLPIVNWQLIILPSRLGRYLVTAQALLNQTTTTFASVHLESRSYSAPTRAKQLARIFPHLASEPHVIVTGDFNFCSTSDENRQLDPTYQDVWPLLHQTEPGFTENTDVNTMRWFQTGKHEQVRFDRILLRSQQPGWQARSIQLIGTEPISTATPDIFPSDHFGLLGRFDWLL
jgi:tyrosyl-DNA phosphodiesterase 2